MSSHEFIVFEGEPLTGHVRMFIPNILFGALLAILVVGLIWIVNHLKIGTQGGSTLTQASTSNFTAAHPNKLEQDQVGIANRAMPTAKPRRAPFTEAPVFWETNQQLQNYYSDKNVYAAPAAGESFTDGELLRRNQGQ